MITSVVRWASKKAGGSSRNKKGHAPGKRRGIKAADGSHVTINSILMRQLHIRCHPGLNVSRYDDLPHRESLIVFVQITGWNR